MKLSFTRRSKKVEKCETCGRDESKCLCHNHKRSPLMDGSKYDWTEDTRKKREKWDKAKEEDND